MPLEPGSRLGHYELLALLGAGGMGEVYRATDNRLGRDVAIKILPPEVAQDQDRLARFRREAHLLAFLNHPNIATIHGLEEADGQPFLILELVEGKTLADCLKDGAIPVGEALEIARQTASALEEAHEKGIIHRDLKPANVKVTPDGKVKVLDFGLAKALAGDLDTDAASELSQSPTLAHSGTQAGVILGTAAYMSPEQARGKPVDKRADVWAFGVLVWEMLTGRALFAGDTVTDILAAVVKEDPDLDALPEETPGAVRRLVARCLRKDRRERLRDIGDARLELEELKSVRGRRIEEVAGELKPYPQRSRWRRDLVVGGVALTVGAAAGLATRADWGSAPVRRAGEPVVRFALDAPPELELTNACLGVSPDGRHVAVRTDTSYRDLWVLSLDGHAARQLPVSSASCPFWSPDGAQVAFAKWTAGRTELQSVHLEGGGVQTIGAVESPNLSFAHATWGRQGLIVFGLSGQIHTVAAAGSEPTVLIEPDVSRGERQLLNPQLLPDGRGLLYGVNLDEGREFWLTSVDEPDRRTRLLSGVSWARYVDTGHLVYARDGRLFSQAFIAGRGELVGSPVRLDSVAMDLRFEKGLFDVSSSGVLAYIQGGASTRVLSWFNREGALLGRLAEPMLYHEIRLSPDDSRVAAGVSVRGRAATDIGSVEATDIWTVDVARGVATPEISNAGAPLWSPDGKHLYFQRVTEDAVTRSYRKGLGSSAPPTLVRDDPRDIYPESVSPDGLMLVYLTGQSPKVNQMYALSLDRAGEPELLLEVDHLDGVEVSPDGRWLAYITDQTGDWEVYVSPFRREGRTVRVSNRGGRQPQWRGDGRELFYVTPEGDLMAVEVRSTEGQPAVGKPTLLFRAGVNTPYHDRYDVTRDGQRFLVAPLAEGSEPSLKVMLNWTSLVEGS